MGIFMSVFLQRHCELLLLHIIIHLHSNQTSPSHMIYEREAKQKVLEAEGRQAWHGRGKARRGREEKKVQVRS